MAKEKKTEAKFGLASSNVSQHGKLVVVNEDAEHDGELYKAGNHDLPAGVADALINDEKAFEPEGKGKGRDVQTIETEGDKENIIVGGPAVGTPGDVVSESPTSG